MHASPGLRNFIIMVCGYTPEPVIDKFGNQVIGFGHIIRKRELGRLRRVDEKEAYELLSDDLEYHGNKVEKIIYPELAQGQFDAILSFCLSVGLRRFKRSCVVRTLNNGKFDNVPEALMRWIYRIGQDGTLIEDDDLIHRRRSEVFIFTGGKN